MSTPPTTPTRPTEQPAYLDDARAQFGRMPAPVPLAPPRLAQEDGDDGSGPVNWNPLANAMADAQGVPVGSWNWMQGGPAAFSGSAGAQASYGWRHDHKLSPSYIRAVLANYGHRRSYYTNAPFRQFNYEAAGRPHGWTPEDPGDQADGSTYYWGSNGPVRVTGPDAEHLWLTPLFALIDDPNPIDVDTGLGTKMKSNQVARWLASMLVSSAVGMVRDKDASGGKPYPWTYGDRATGRLLHTMVMGFWRGCLPKKDLATAMQFLANIVLPFYESGPGIHQFGRYIAGVHPPSAEGRFSLGLFNGLHWIVPVMSDTANVCRKVGLEEWAVRADQLVARWSQWMVDLYEVRTDCFQAGRVFLDPAFGELAEPPASIWPYLRRDEPGDWQFGSDFRPWAFRAVDIANEVTGKLRDPVLSILEEFEGNQSQRQWMVGADGDYAP